MSGLHEVDCSGCGRRHSLSAEQARKQRVLRCSCGHFVRMDRSLAEARSDPAPAPKAELADVNDDDDERTHMVDSLSAIAALGNKPPRAPQASLSGAERKSQPPPRAPMRSMSPSPSRPNSEPPGDKPLWYVDLGGIETVEMTIEQLIIARRSGKLGEGALVWREGMPRWRPVGTLIPATSIASRPTPTPPPPGSPSPTSPPPSLTVQGAPAEQPVRRPSDPPPVSLGSYERPLATLEFALETPASAASRIGARPPPAPPPLTPPARSSQTFRAATPVPARLPTPVPARLPTPVPARSATPVPTRLPTPVPVRSATPVPARLPTPVPPVPQPAAWKTPTSVVAPLPVSSSVAATAPVTLPPSGHSPFQSDRPRWLTASMALLLCIAASGSGAFLVRAFRGHRQPLQLAPSPASSVLQSSSSSARMPSEPTAPVAADPSPAPQVVDIASLSIERSPPRAIIRPVVPKPALEPAATDDTGDTEPAPATTASSPQKPKVSDSPAATHTNPPPGAVDNSGVNKAPTPSGDAPGY
jgi:hypothetical protein